MPDEPLRSSRRDVLKGALAAGLASPAVAAEAEAPSNATVQENSQHGHRDWQLTRLRLNKSGGNRSPFIEGYCSRQSVAPGERIEFKVSTNPPIDSQLEIFRMGYYGGAGARRMTVLGPLQGRTQPDPEIGP